MRRNAIYLPATVEGAAPGCRTRARSAGLLAPIGGLNPFVKSASAAIGPTGAPPSPLFGATPFSPVKFHRAWPTQLKNSVWTFDGSVPPKLLRERYGEPVLCPGQRHVHSKGSKGRSQARTDTSVR